MTYNGWTRLNIVLEMVDPYDYDEFARICEAEKIPLLSLYEFSTKSGLLQVALRRYPEMPVEEAYMKIVQDANTQNIPLPQGAAGDSAKKSGGCSSCGGKKEDKPLPSLTTQAGNFATAIGQHAMDGFKETEKEVLEKRMTECNNCEDMRSDGRCAKCGCYMQIKAKWDSAKCPVGKW